MPRKGNLLPFAGLAIFRLPRCTSTDGQTHGQCNGLIEAGGTLRWVYDPEPSRVKEFCQRYPQATPAANLDQILEDPSIKLVTAAAVPSQRGRLQCAAASGPAAGARARECPRHPTHCHQLPASRPACRGAALAYKISCARSCAWQVNDDVLRDRGAPSPRRLGSVPRRRPALPMTTRPNARRSSWWGPRRWPRCIRETCRRQSGVAPGVARVHHEEERRAGLHQAPIGVPRRDMATQVDDRLPAQMSQIVTLANRSGSASRSRRSAMPLVPGGAAEERARIGVPGATDQHFQLLLRDDAGSHREGLFPHVGLGEGVRGRRCNPQPRAH